MAIPQRSGVRLAMNGANTARTATVATQAIPIFAPVLRRVSRVTRRENDSSPTFSTALVMAVSVIRS